MLIVVSLVASHTISILAETHRALLDFSEGESEFVFGFDIEYRSLVRINFYSEHINIYL